MIKHIDVYYTNKIGVSNNFPSHVAIIPDGDRRWAKNNSTNLTSGYLEGMRTVEKIIVHAKKQGIKFVSFWILSHDNENRSNLWKETFFQLLRTYIQSKCDQMIAKNIAVKFIGEWEVLPHDIVDNIKFVLNRNPQNPDMTVGFLLRYSGRNDLVYAIQSLVAANDSPMNIDKYLYTSLSNFPDPELVIRTSGVYRLSNYMLYQCAYSELYFTKTLWPDFTEKEFDFALDWYKNQEKRRGR